MVCPRRTRADARRIPPRRSDRQAPGGRGAPTRRACARQDAPTARADARSLCGSRAARLGVRRASATPPYPRALVDGANGPPAPPPARRSGSVRRRRACGDPRPSPPSVGLARAGRLRQAPPKLPGRTLPQSWRRQSRAARAVAPCRSRRDRGGPTRRPPRSPPGHAAWIPTPPAPPPDRAARAPDPGSAQAPPQAPYPCVPPAPRPLPRLLRCVAPSPVTARSRAPARRARSLLRRRGPARNGVVGRIRSWANICSHRPTTDV